MTTAKDVAVAAYNSCWDLLERDRTDAEDVALMAAAFESRYFWAGAGGPQEHAVADWMVSRAAAATGNPRLALTFAWASLEHDGEGFPAWLQASLLEGLARALVSGGADPEAQTVMDRARDILREEPDIESADVIEGQIRELERILSDKH
jgi:hypothetical protein